MIALILIGDIIVCGFLVGITAWLLTRGEKEKFQEVANLPLLDDEQTWQGRGAPSFARKEEEC